MKAVIQKEEIEKMNRYGKIYIIMLIIMVVSVVPLFMWLSVWAFIPLGIIYAIALYIAFKIEKVECIEKSICSIFCSFLEKVIKKLLTFCYWSSWIFRWHNL